MTLSVHTKSAFNWDCKYTLVVCLYDSCDWLTEDVIIKVQTTSAHVWDPSM